MKKYLVFIDLMVTHLQLDPSEVLESLPISEYEKHELSVLYIQTKAIQLLHPSAI